VTITNNNKPLLHRKEWQMMTPVPVASGNLMFVAGDPAGRSNYALYVTSGTMMYLHHLDEDAYVQIPSPSLATFAVGACGTFHPWSNTYTANGGSTTTVTVAAASHNLNGTVIGSVIEFRSGLNIGVRTTVTGIMTNGGSGTITLTLGSTLSNAVVNTDTFRLDTGRFFVYGGGVTAAGSFKSFDIGTLNWSGNLTVTNVPTFTIDGEMTSAYQIPAIFATGTATAGSAGGSGTTLTNTGKNWTANQWTNYQVRITAGAGIGQIRTIALNTATQLTVSSAWTTTTDATSVYAIEGNEDHIYMIGNNAVTMYKYSISGNSWAVMAPTTARAGAAVAAATLDWCSVTGDTGWANENDIKDGRYLYSVRGGGALIDRFDIAGGTAGAGAWANMSFPGVETFSTGSSAHLIGRYLYIRKDATNRIFKYSVRGNYLEPVSTNLFADSTAILGGKVWIKDYDSTGSVRWLYSLMNTGTAVHRLMLY
jgi:hypothetical protein